MLKKLLFFGTFLTIILGSGVAINQVKADIAIQEKFNGCPPGQKKVVCRTGQRILHGWLWECDEYNKDSRYTEAGFESQTYPVYCFNSGPVNLLISQVVQNKWKLVEAILMTVVMEVVVFWSMGFVSREETWRVGLVNLVSPLLLNLGLFAARAYEMNADILGEGIVIVAEIWVFISMFPKAKKERVILTVFIANLASFLTPIVVSLIVNSWLSLIFPGLF